MVLEKSQPAAESMPLLAGGGFNEVGILPKGLLEEAEEFAKRNSLVVINYKEKEKNSVHVCCQRCLKAHMIKTSKFMGLGNVEAKLKKLMNCDEGHAGYYTDADKLIKI